MNNDTLIPTNDGLDTKQITYAELKEQIDRFKNESSKAIDCFGKDEWYIKNFAYKNFACRIKFYRGCFLGYVDGFDPDLEKYFSDEEITSPSSIEDIYYPHGDFTADHGFDCNHFDDINISQQLSSSSSGHSNKTFKTESFVTLEIKNIVDSIITIASNRIK